MKMLPLLGGICLLIVVGCTLHNDPVSYPSAQAAHNTLGPVPDPASTNAGTLRTVPGGSSPYGSGPGSAGNVGSFGDSGRGQ